MSSPCGGQYGQSIYDALQTDLPVSMGSAGKDPTKDDVVGAASRTEDIELIIADACLRSAIGVVPVAGVFSIALARWTA